MSDKPEFLIIPAAGLGTRMRSVGASRPKELLPVGPKPAIQYAVEEAISVGIQNIIIIINPKKEIIRRYFEDSGFGASLFPGACTEMERIRENCNFTFLYQRELSGEADAIGLTSGIIGKRSFAVIYPDNIYLPAPGALRILVPVYEELKTDVVALTSVASEEAQGLGNSGRVDLTQLQEDAYHITRIYPKGRDRFIPRHQNELRTCGISITGPHFFDCIEMARLSLKPGQELTDIMVRSLILEERQIVGYRLPGRLFDIGNPDGYRRCLEFIRQSY